MSTSPGFAGTWAIDLGASESLDPMLKLQGMSWPLRQVMRALKFTQTFGIEGDQLTIAVSSLFRSNSDTFTLGGPWVERDGELTGKIQIRHFFAAGAHLVTESDLTLADRSAARLTIDRALEGQSRMFALVTLLCHGDGRTLSARRVFHRR